MSFQPFPSGTECSLCTVTVLSFHSTASWSRELYHSRELVKTSSTQEVWLLHPCQNTLYLNNIFQKKTYKTSSFALWGDKVSENYSQTTALAPLLVFFDLSGRNPSSNAFTRFFIIQRQFPELPKFLIL